MKISQFLVVISVYLTLNVDSARCLTQQQSDLIDSVVELFRTENFVPGLALSVVQDGEIVIEKGYGKKNIDDNLDADNNTLFAIGSITKSFTSLLVVKILSEKFPDLGEAVLDVPIVKLGENLNFTLIDRFRSESTSFRDLLSHRTCLSNAASILLFDVAPIEEWIYRSRYDTEVCSHRAGYLYNNVLYALAGSLIGKIAGKSYPELMAELLIELGMTSSRVVDAEGSHEDLPNMSRAYTRHDGQVLEFNRTHLRRLSLAGGAGGILSTASDMSRYVKFYLSGGNISGKQVVPEATLKWMYKVSIPIPTFDFLSTTGGYGYSLGLIMAYFAGQPWIAHNGYWPPYESAFSLFPTYKNISVGIFSSINGPGMTGLIPDALSQQIVHITIMQILHGETTLDEILEKTNKSMVRETSRTISEAALPINSNLSSTKPKANKKSSRTKLQTAELVGLYGNSQHGDLTITLNSDIPDNLNINYGKWGIGILTPHPTDINVFSVEWTTTINYDFYSYGSLVPVPVFTIDFRTVEKVHLIQNGVQIPGSFIRDATLDTFPEIPWHTDSGGPKLGPNFGVVVAGCISLNLIYQSSFGSIGTILSDIK